MYKPFNGSISLKGGCKTENRRYAKGEGVSKFVRVRTRRGRGYKIPIFVCTYFIHHKGAKSPIHHSAQCQMFSKHRLVKVGSVNLCTNFPKSGVSSLILWKKHQLDNQQVALLNTYNCCC